MTNTPNSLSQSVVDCPIDGIQVNENKVRTVAFFVLLTGIAYLITQYWLLPLVLLIDFALRTFNYGQFSLFARLSDWTVKTLHFPVHLIDQAPKRFAAGVGLVFAVAILTLHLLGISTLVLTGVLVLFAALESLAGFCAGCSVYSFLKNIRLI